MPSREMPNRVHRISKRSKRYFLADSPLVYLYNTRGACLGIKIRQSWSNAREKVFVLWNPGFLISREFPIPTSITIHRISIRYDIASRAESHRIPRTNSQEREREPWTTRLGDARINLRLARALALARLTLGITIACVYARGSMWHNSQLRQSLLVLTHRARIR